MPLLYVTGLAATGKSAILAELLTRGYRAYGVDEDSYADWISQETGEPEPMPALADLDFPSWYKTHYWLLNGPRITELSQQAAESGDPVFLCGVADGDKEVWHLFSQVIALVADLATLRQRIAVRDNLFGKEPEQFADIARWHDGYERSYRSFGTVIIDATRPLHQVVDQILVIAAAENQTGLAPTYRP
jgi:hypothetical protein